MTELIVKIDDMTLLPEIENAISHLRGVISVSTRKKRDKKVAKSSEAEEWTREQEREAFLHTSRVNASKILAKYL